MRILLQNNIQLRGDIIKQVIVRSDMSPVPVTVEGEIRVDDSIKGQFDEGKILTVNADKFIIVNSNSAAGRESQGQHSTDGVKFIAFLASCAPVATPLKAAIIKNNCLLTEAYRAAGATIQKVVNDFRADRFSSMKGDPASVGIVQWLQDEGGIVRYKNGRLEYFRVNDLFNQKPVLTLPDNATENIYNTFMQLHEVPTYYSTAIDGSFIYGTELKNRKMTYVPGKNQQQLFNMSRILIQKKVSRINYNESICAGDVISFQGSDLLTVVTAAHVFENNIDGSGSNQYTKLWLSEVGLK